MKGRKWCVEKRDMKEIRRGKHEREERVISSTSGAEQRTPEILQMRPVTRWTLIKRDTEDLKQSILPHVQRRGLHSILAQIMWNAKMTAWGNGKERGVVWFPSRNASVTSVPVYPFHCH